MLMLMLMKKNFFFCMLSSRIFLFHSRFSFGCEYLVANLALRHLPRAACTACRLGVVRRLSKEKEKWWISGGSYQRHENRFWAAFPRFLQRCTLITLPNSGTDVATPHY